MTLDKHQIDGLSPILSKILPAEVFEQLMLNAGYTVVGSALAKGNRIKVWYNHPGFRRIEAIYTLNGLKVNFFEENTRAGKDAFHVLLNAVIESR